jgi:hypothetical protein
VGSSHHPLGGFRASGLPSTSGCGWMNGRGITVMRSTSPPWMWIALVLAVLTISYLTAPPVPLRQAAVLWGWS